MTVRVCDIAKIYINYTIIYVCTIIHSTELLRHYLPHYFII